ncbi:Leucine-rich repeat-containing protein [Intoshia linei]|uniref:Leucine-rich repeat-containing protein n=1 Tax=Intoshia linei TaxID=1819745 RepID=A0A177B5U7_9BILA|nr:Leucine-rich repeat-containing protein [Intoshia linei]
MVETNVSNEKPTATNLDHPVKNNKDLADSTITLINQVQTDYNKEDSIYKKYERQQTGQTQHFNEFILDNFVKNCEINQTNDDDNKIDRHESQSANMFPNMPYDPTGIDQYLIECKKLNEVPISIFIKRIMDKKMSMKYYGLSGKACVAMTKALEINNRIEKMDLQGNCIDIKGISQLSYTLRDNISLHDLNVSENLFGDLGCKHLFNNLKINKSIVILDLSGNNLTDNIGESLYELLHNNSTLRFLYLKNNKLEKESIYWIKEALLHNESLKILDLSWNLMRKSTCPYLAEIIRENYGLKELNLAMNGLAEGVASFGEALKRNQSLIELNLHTNRINSKTFQMLSNGLTENDVLRSLLVSYNDISPESVFYMLQSLNKNDKTEMEYVNLSTSFINEDGKEVYEKIKSYRTFKLVYAGIKSKEGLLKMTEMTNEERFRNDPMTKLRDYADKAGYRLLDLFVSFDRDQSWSITHEELKSGIEKIGLELSEKEMTIMINKLDIDNDGSIDYKELAMGDKKNKKEERKYREISKTIK